MLTPELAVDTHWAVETCLDAQALREHLQPIVAPHDAIATLHITKAHRSASKRRDPHPLTFCCEMETVGGVTKRFYGKVYREGASTQAARTSQALHVPSLDLLLWTWPDDPGLPQLAQLLSPRATVPLWREAAASVALVRYEPERRATLRYTHTDGRVIYAKTFSTDRGAAVHRRFVWMWEQAQQHADSPRVARPLQCSLDGRTVWQAAATGTPLMNGLATSPHADFRANWLLPLAGAIATVHQAPLALAGPLPRDLHHWLAEVRRRRQKISRVMPELAPTVEATTRLIEQSAMHLPTHPLAVIHGDFHPDQVWFDGHRIVLFDFDEFALGDPMEDLAEFIVKLPPSAGSDAFVARWLEAYAQLAPQHFCSQRLRWHMAVQQLLQASRAFVFQVPDWRGEVHRRLDRAAQFAAQITQAVSA